VGHGETAFQWGSYRINGENIYGPRNIKIGDSLEEVIKKVPNTIELEFDPIYVDLSEYTLVEPIASGTTELDTNISDCAIFLLTKNAEKKYLENYISYDLVSEIEMDVY